MLDIKITRTATPKAKPTDETKLGFGKKFSDHMFVMDYTEGEGWHDARIVPYGPFELDPATVVFHYAQEIFEGMKACLLYTSFFKALRYRELRPAEQENGTVPRNELVYEHTLS